MLFLFSPKGMGIAPIIKLSVVNGTCIPLLFLPRFHGFGTNESQPTCCIDCRCILERRLRLCEDAPEHIRLRCQERPYILSPLLAIARLTRQRHIAETIRATFSARMDMLDLQWDILRATIGAHPVPLLKQIFACLIALQGALLVLDALDLGLLHSVHVELDQFL